MVDQDVDIQGLGRELFAAWLVFAIGGMLFAGMCLLLVFPDSAGSTRSSDSAAAQEQAAIELCSAGLATARGFGIVPAYTKLASSLVQPGNARGRYTCFAQTNSAKYQITFDLICKDLSDPKCVALFGVMQDGTGSLYQRR